MTASINNKIRKPHLNNIDWLALISIALVIIFFVTLRTVYIFPIYPDEIQVRFWLSRLPYDFPERISGAPACLATFFQPIPVTMYLPGFINWLIHGKLGSIPALRQMGVIVVFLWVAGLALYLNNRAKRSMAQGHIQLRHGLLGLYITGFFIALFSVGVFPIFLVTNRGEQLILPSVVILITIFLVSDRLRQNGHWRQKTGLIVLYFVSVSVILYGHIKGILLAPLFVIVGWQLFRSFKSRLPFAFAMALLFLHIAQDLAAWKYAFKCSELPQFEALLKSFSLDPASLIYDPRHFFDQVSHSLIQFPKYLHQLGFQEKTDADYLPIKPLAASANIANFFIKLNFSVAFIALLIAIPFKYFRNDIASNRYVTINLVLLVTFVCVLISAIFNLPKNWYDAGYIFTVSCNCNIFNRRKFLWNISNIRY